MSKKTIYLSPAVEEIELFIETPVAGSVYDQNGDLLTPTDTEYDW